MAVLQLLYVSFKLNHVRYNSTYSAVVSCVLNLESVDAQCTGVVGQQSLCISNGTCARLNTSWGMVIYTLSCSVSMQQNLNFPRLRNCILVVCIFLLYLL
jgi:hypothetical protein